MSKSILLSLFASSSFAWGACASKDKPAPVAEPDRVLGTAVAKLEARSGSEVTGTVTFTERQTTRDGVNVRVVDVRYDISFQLMTELGERWERKQSEKRIELVRDDSHWLFVSGM